MATSWSTLLTVDGSGNYVTAVSRNATITGGTALTLPLGETGSFGYLPAVLERAKRIILNKRSTGVITDTSNISFQITVTSDSQGNLFTATAQYGATSLSGGSSITMPLGETTATFLQSAIQRAFRTIKKDYAAGN